MTGGRRGRLEREVKTGILQSRQNTLGRSSGVAYYEFELLVLEGILDRCAQLVRLAVDKQASGPVNLQQPHGLQQPGKKTNVVTGVI